MPEPRERIARALSRLQGHPSDIRVEGKPMWPSFLPEADAALAAADIDPLIALLARSKRTPPYPRRFATKLQPFCANTLPDGALPFARPRRPVPRRTLRAQTCDDRSRLPRSSASLLVPYFKIAPGTCCPPGEGLPAEECHVLTPALRIGRRRVADLARS
jgi:hypothetical protein